MKALVFVLVLANLLFFAYAEGYFGRPGNPDAGRVAQQVSPERIRVVARSEPPVAKAEDRKEVAPVEDGAAAAAREAAAEKPALAEKPAGAEKPATVEKPAAMEKQAAAKPVPQDVCVAWSGLSGSDANRVAALMAGKFAEFKVERRALAADGSSWWVYIPPLANKAEADRKVGELKRLGVNDYFIVQEAGPSHFAISLGVFSTEAGAGELLASLKDKGVKSARLAPRPGKDAPQAIEARGPASRRGALQAAVAAVLPESAPRACRESP